jgi:3-oxoacyl-[acyl-carrier protein] reductase
MVNTISDSGLFGQAGIVGYSVAKAAIAGLTTVLARELERYGVLVNALAPTAFRTRLLSGPAAEAGDPSGLGDASAWDPLDPAHLGPTVVWLASPSLAFSGQVVWSSGDSVELYEGWRPVSRVAVPARPLTYDELVAASLFDGHPVRPDPVPPQGWGHWDWFHSPSLSGHASSESSS